MQKAIIRQMYKAEEEKQNAYILAVRSCNPCAPVIHFIYQNADIMQRLEIESILISLWDRYNNKSTERNKRPIDATEQIYSKLTEKELKAVQRATESTTEHEYIKFIKSNVYVLGIEILLESIPAPVLIDLNVELIKDLCSISSVAHC